MNKLQIYKASAGSGKTYLLTENYLKLAFESNDRFRKILAVTFTNKAASEMKGRIIDELNNIISKGKEAQHYKQIANYLNTDSLDFIVQRAKSVRDTLLHNYSVFFVGTIDSFVQKVVRSFAYEMNLNSTYDIEMDDNRVISFLTERIYENAAENKELQNWLINFAQFKIEENKTWDFRKEIYNLAQELFKENFQSLFGKEHGSNLNMHIISSFREKLIAIKAAFELKMSKISERYIEIIDKNQIDYLNCGKNFTTVSNLFFKKIPDKNYDNTSPTIINALESKEYWHNKNTDQVKISTIYSHFNELYSCLEDYFALLNNESTIYYTADVILQNYFSFGILNDLASLLPEYRDNLNVLLISDTNYLLKEIIGNNDAPFIYEKFGNRFNHILIDEFQDTSKFQWDNFKPLIENSLSNGYYNMIVGDIKQSIYRWRNGDWKLLHEKVQKDIGTTFIEDETLDKNWRSRINIIEFNNFIFRELSKILQLQYNAEIDQLSNAKLKKQIVNEGYTEVIKKAYQNHEQICPDKAGKKGGSVNLYFSEGTSLTEYKDKLSEIFPKYIDGLIKTEQVKASEIGILVRKNSEAKVIASMLLDYRNKHSDAESFLILSPESLTVNNSVSVKLLIAAFNYINDKKNTVNTANLLYHYFLCKEAKATDLSPAFLSVENDEFDKYLPDDFINNVEDLKMLSLYELCEEIISIFKLYENTNDFIFIKTFQNLIAEQTSKQNNNLSDFLEWWNKKGNEKSVQFSDETDAVRIMTIHSSKGLAFKYVFIPFANISIDHGTNSPLIWVKSEQKPFDRLDFVPVKYSKKLINSFFVKDYLNEKLYAYVDSLNLLYVAFTRAKDELHVFSGIPKNRNKNYSASGIMLYDIIQKMNKEGNKDLIYFQKEPTGRFTNYRFSKGHSVISEDSQKEMEINSRTFEPKMYPNTIIKDRIQINFSSEDFFIESIEDIEHKVNYGILMHQIFSNIKYPNDIDTALERMIKEGYITENEKNDLKIKVNEYVSSATISEWFSESFDVITEEALINAKGDIRIPDRIIKNHEKIIVIDFKFGKKHKKYSEQLKEYKELISEIYKLKTEAYIYYAETDTKEQI
jgi:ATP-dependent helicase/nuclease subunit A